MNDAIVRNQGRLPDPLSEREHRLLVQLEADIEQNLKGFRKVGYALTVIRDQALYRVNYDTFEDYCREEWDLGRPRAYQLIDSHTVVHNLSTMVDKTNSSTMEILPANERQARPLAILTIEQQIAVWRQVVEEAAGRKITATMVQQCVDALLQKKVKDTISKAKNEINNTEDGEVNSLKIAMQPIFELINRGMETHWKEVKKTLLINTLRDLIDALDD